MKVKLRIQKEGAALYETTYEVFDADGFGKACADVWNQLRERRLARASSIGALFDGLEDRRKPSVQLDQEQAIPISEMNTTANLPLQHDQLMTERSVLGLKSALRLEGRDEQGQEETEQRDHRR